MPSAPKDVMTRHSANGSWRCPSVRRCVQSAPAQIAEWRFAKQCV